MEPLSVLEQEEHQVETNDPQGLDRLYICPITTAFRKEVDEEDKDKQGPRQEQKLLQLHHRRGSVEELHRDV